jgi:hypothetical protein
MATKTAPKATSPLTAYCMKTKEKNVPIQNAVISLKSGRYIAKGDDGNGNIITTILNKEKAEKFITDGIAEAGEGIAEAKPKAKKK